MVRCAPAGTRDGHGVRKWSARWLHVGDIAEPAGCVRGVAFHEGFFIDRAEAFIDADRVQQPFAIVRDRAEGDKLTGLVRAKDGPATL